MTERVAQRAPRLIDYLRDWRAPGIGIPKAQLELAPVHLRRAVQEVERRIGDLSPRAPAPHDLDQIELSIRRAWKDSASIRSVPPQHLRRAPWVLFRPEGQPDRWLARVAGFMPAWLSWLADDQRARTVVSLLREFLAAYPHEIEQFDATRRAIGSGLARGRSPRLARWRDRCARFGLLESAAPALLTQYWWDTSVSFEEYGAEAGVVPGLETSAFVRKASEHVLELVETRLRERSATVTWLARALEWFERDGRLRLAGLRIRTAIALLSPFLERDPEAAVREMIQSFLLRLIGDPRSQRARWQGIPDHIRNVLLRWLVRISLEDFFRVLDETAVDAHWRYRKAFWSAYLNEEKIADAWVVLGPAAGRKARRDLEAQGGAGKLVLGEGVESTHSVLLMRIGNLTIAEWSHNGKCWIWTEGKGKPPKLYEPEYRRVDLRERGAWSQVHSRSDTGHWQDEVARKIDREMGVRVSRTQYMPERKRWR